MKTKKKTLILDVKKWRCGGESNVKENYKGIGDTCLLNQKGKMCCLGQFAPQLNPEIKRKDLLDVGTPDGLEVKIPLLINTKGVDSRLTTRAININDNEKTSVKTKIQKLKALFATKGYTIKVINNK